MKAFYAGRLTTAVDIGSPYSDINICELITIIPMRFKIINEVYRMSLVSTSMTCISPVIARCNIINSIFNIIRSWRRSSVILVKPGNIKFRTAFSRHIETYIIRLERFQ